jgi:hypothetical protein
MATDQLNPRLRMLLSLLPKHGWQVKPAAIEAGYSESYADRLSAILKRNVRFCQAVASKQAEIGATEAEKVARLVQSWEEIAHDDSVPVRDRLRAGELLGKYHAIFSERCVIETPERHRVLDEAQVQAAREFALWWGQRQTPRFSADVQALPDRADEQDPAQ